MKTKLLPFTLLAALLCAHAFAAEPNVTFTVEPTEPDANGSLVYAPMGKLTASDPATGRLWFKVNITNHGGVALTLTSIRVTMTGLDVSFPRSVSCAANATTSDSLKDEGETGGATIETITVPHPAPPNVAIWLYFSGNVTPKIGIKNLAPYEPATPNGQYFYPADEGDIGPNEYFSDSHAHGPGAQMWGADWKVYRVIAQGSTSTLRAGTDGSANEDSLGWGVPIRAIADGTVLRTSTGLINNPAPGVRAFQKMAEYDGEAIDDVKVTRLSTTRAASLQRLPAGQVQLSIWDVTDTGRQIVRLSSSTIDNAEITTAMALEAMTSTRIVAAVRLTNGNLRILVWDIPEDGLSVPPPRAIFTGGVLEVSLIKMSSTRFATCTRTAAGNLNVIVWKVTGSTLGSLGSDSGGAATSVCVSALSDSRVATSLRTDQGALKVIVWDLVDDGGGFYHLERRGEATAENISRVVAANNDGGKWVTAMRTSPGGSLKLARWAASEDGMTLTPELVTPAHAIQNAPLAIAPGTGKAGVVHATTATIVAGGIFQINGWGNDPVNSPNNYEASAQNTAGAVSTVSLDELGDTEYFAGVRTTGGALKIMTWHWAGGGGNSVVMLHGNCRVLYAHFQDGSVDANVLYPGATVSAGQRLGNQGNAGSSSGPHTHINAERVEDGHTIEELIAYDAAYAISGDRTDLHIVGPRPMPYTSARAMRLSLIAPGGEGNPGNSFATMSGQGMYDISLGIRPRLNTRYVDRTATFPAPTGRKEPLPATGGPFSQIAPALPVVPSGGRLYIRGGSYDETITFTTPMTVRRYDYYKTGGAAIIGK